MGSVFARGPATADLMTARPGSVAAGMRRTFAVAAVLLVGALALASRRAVRPNRGQQRGRIWRAKMHGATSVVRCVFAALSLRAEL
jgi:hypothetical protein